MQNTTSIKVFTELVDHALDRSTLVLPYIQDHGTSGKMLMLVVDGNPYCTFKASTPAICQKVHHLLVKRIAIFTAKHVYVSTRSVIPFVERHNHRIYSQEELFGIAKITRQYLRLNTWCAIGARDLRVLYDERYQSGGLRLNVTVKPGKKNVLFLRLRWDDTYSVELWQVRGLTYKLESCLDGLHCDELDEAVYWICTPYGRDTAWEQAIKDGRMDSFNDFNHTQELSNG